MNCCDVQAGSIAFMAIWMYYAAYTASLGEITTKTVENASGLDISYKVRERPALHCLRAPTPLLRACACAPG